MLILFCMFMHYATELQMLAIPRFKDLRVVKCQEPKDQIHKKKFGDNIPRKSAPK
jgi:hypothetical protein